MVNDFVTFDRPNLIITVDLGSEKLVIGRYDVRISFFSGGHGGQNVNKNMSGVRLIYEIPERLRIGSIKTREIVSKSISQRKKEQNLEEAFRQLSEKLRYYFYIKPNRRETAVPKSEKRIRMNDKKIKSRTKSSRKPVNIID